jgi:hypothetical protein
MDRPLFKCRCIATDKLGDEIRYSLAWVFAFRGEMRLTTEAIEWGNHRILYVEIEEANLVRVITAFGEPYNLIIRSRGRIWQFQLPSNSRFGFAHFALEPWWSICRLPAVPFVLDPFWVGDRLPLSVNHTYYLCDMLRARKEYKKSFAVPLLVFFCILLVVSVFFC